MYPEWGLGGAGTVTIRYLIATERMIGRCDNRLVAQEKIMRSPQLPEITCTRWMAQIRLREGSDLVVHIHRGSPISARDALKVARQTARVGKVAAVLPVGPCHDLSDD